jgi:hypothetical protein
VPLKKRQIYSCVSTKWDLCTTVRCESRGQELHNKFERRDNAFAEACIVFSYNEKLLLLLLLLLRQDSAVGIATGYGMRTEGSEFEPQ